MIWVPATLVAIAVFIVMQPDPAHRLEAILGVAQRQTAGSLLRAFGARLFSKGRERSAARQLAIEALGCLSAELSAGTPSQRALVIAGEHAWPAACGAVRFDGDVAEALRQDARRIPLIAPLAACWAVSAQQGSGLASSVTRMAEQARVAEDIRVQLEAQLASPRATARILMLLPLFGIAMGMMMGVNPVGWLLGTPLGLACLVGGLALTALGYWWTSRIVQRVERLL
jgi:tight adherence protein B